jgi:hypothetical protein
MSQRLGYFWADAWGRVGDRSLKLARLRGAIPFRLDVLPRLRDYPQV